MSLIVLKELKSQKSEEIFANYYFFGSVCTLQNTNDRIQRIFSFLVT
jgi:hypothetical protein